MIAPGTTCRKSGARIPSRATGSSSTCSHRFSRASNSCFESSSDLGPADVTRENDQRKKGARNHAIPRSHRKLFDSALLEPDRKSCRSHSIATPPLSVRLRPTLGGLSGFCGCKISGAMIFAAFAEKLADHFFHGHFLDVDVAYVAGFEQFTTGFGDFRARNFQLD